MKKTKLSQALTYLGQHCSLTSANFSLNRAAGMMLFVFTLLFTTHESVFAQCNVTAVVEGNNVIYTVTNPTAGVTYTWTADFSLPDNAPFSANGTSFTVALQLPLPNTFSIQLVSSDNPNTPCWSVGPVYVQETCLEGAGFSFEENGCTVQFIRDNVTNGPILISSSWDFGDGSPVSHDSNPTYTYPSPGGIFQVSLASIIGYPDNNSWNIFICKEPVTTSCGTLCETPPDLGYNTMEFFDCCKLKVSFDANCDDCQHTWEFGNCGTSTVINPVFTVENLSTYTDGTPSIPVIHTIICPGQSPVSQTTTYTFQNQGIFAGTSGNPFAVVSLLNLVSCQNGAPLFPGSSLPSPTTRNIYFYSTVNIDKPYTFNADHICMDPCTGINIAPITTLSLNLGTVIENGPGCGIWRGIQIGTGNGQLVVTGQSIIRDAMVGARAMGPTSIVRLAGAQFINNFVGFAAETSFILQGATPFNDNTFKGDGAMDTHCGTPPSFIGQAYSSVQPFAGVFLLNSTLNIPNGPENTFSYMANGIWMNNSSSIALRLCNFDHMSGAGYGSQGGNGIMFLDGTGGHELRHTGGTFNTCVTGIFANVFGPGSKFRSINATMNPVEEGYRFVSSGSIVPFTTTSRSRVTGANVTSTRFGLLFNVAALGASNGFLNQMDVHSNTFTATTGHGVILQSFVPGPGQPGAPTQDVNVGGAGSLLNSITINSSNGAPYRGVWVDNFNGGTVDNNNITIGGTGSFASGIGLNGGGGTLVQFNNVTGNFVPGSAGNTNFTDGIFTENSAGNTYFDNAFTNTFNGMRFLGNCQMEDAIDCNSMTGHEFGMMYNPSGSITMPTSTDPQDCGLNTWNANIAQGAVYDGTFAQASSSLYFTLPSAPQRPNTVSPLGWFQNGNCTGSCPPNFTGDSPDISATDNLIGATGSVMGDASEAGVNYLYKRTLYRKLLANPTLVSQDTSMQSFKTANANQPLGLLYNVEEQLQAAFQLTASQQAQLDTLSDEIGVLLTDIETLDVLLADSSLTEAQVGQYIAEREVKTNQLDTKYATVSGIYDQWMSQRNSASAAIIAANSAITTVADYDGNEKTLNGIYAAKVLKDLPLNWQERDLILAIARQCIRKGGAAVYRARAWYAALTGVEVLEEDCVIQRSNEGVGSKSLANSGEFKLYPNPATTAFILEGPAMQEGENWRIQLYAGFGQLIGSFDYSVDGRTEIPLQNFPTGIYWCKVSDGKKLLSVQKISIIK